MDGTLTVAMHDFDAMRRALDLPVGVPILEALAALDAEVRSRKRRELDEMELHMAEAAAAQPGARALLETLTERGVRIGIVTRNGKEIAHATLAACGLFDLFEPAAVVSRDCAEAKPDPAGVILALARWRARADDTVMVGDYRFDLEAGHRAGCATVHLDIDSGETWPEFTTLRVGSLTELHRTLG